MNTPFIGLTDRDYMNLDFLCIQVLGYLLRYIHPRIGYYFQTLKIPKNTIRISIFWHISSFWLQMNVRMYTVFSIYFENVHAYIAE